MEQLNVCAVCKEEPIYIKKRGLCIKCYNTQRREHLTSRSRLADKVTRTTLVKYETEGELEFVQNYNCASHLIHHPTAFKLKGTTYIPDFYDPDRNVFIEVASTRQAFHANKAKYDMLREMYPLLPFEIRHSSGALVEQVDGLYRWPIEEADEDTLTAVLVE